MTSNIEKLFMNWVLKNPEHFKNVKGFYFENEDIKFVYDCIRNEYMSSTDKIVPGKKEIFNLVKLYDKTDKINGDFIKALLKVDWTEYRDEFMIPRFKAWVLSNSTINGLVDSIDDIKGLDKTDYTKVQEAVSKVRIKIDEAINIQLDKGSIGLDFDDVDAHDQDLEHNKITTGYPCLDKITEGGWDRKTLNILIGAPASGKCCFKTTKIKVKNKHTNDIIEVSMEAFFAMTRATNKEETVKEETVKEEKLYDKFIEANEVSDWEVLTPNGWINIEGVGKTILFDNWYILTKSGREMICADNHILGKCDNLDFDNKTYDLSECFMKDLNPGDYVITEDGPEEIAFVHISKEQSHMYDLQLSEGSNKHYYTNGFLSHNSIWMQNMAVNAVNAGYNVAYITLELSDKKCLKRIGSMRLDIPIAEYTERAKDKEFMQERIRRINEQDSGVFDNQKPGKLYIREYPSGSATISDMEKYIKQVKEEAGISIDLLVIDYIQIMGTEKGVDRNMLYLKGEHLAVGLRALAQKHNLALLTATQVAKEKYGANDIQLNDIPESKAIADTADMVWAIILTPIMKLESKYHLKHVKLRDCSTDYERVGFSFNKATLRIGGDYYIESTLL